jgi:hypothetical protein
LLDRRLSLAEVAEVELQVEAAAAVMAAAPAAEGARGGEVLQAPEDPWEHMVQVFAAVILEVTGDTVIGR